jgi:hypothetical protein
MVHCVLIPIAGGALLLTDSSILTVVLIGPGIAGVSFFKFKHLFNDLISPSVKSFPESAGF